MNLYFCRFKEEEWGCYVIAVTPTQARSLFADFWSGHGEYIDVRCRKIKTDVEGSIGVYDIDCEALEQLGVRYATEEEMDERWE